MTLNNIFSVTQEANQQQLYNFSYAATCSPTVILPVQITFCPVLTMLYHPTQNTLHLNTEKLKQVTQMHTWRECINASTQQFYQT